MNKQKITIDGVDVAECEFLRNCVILDNYGCKIDDSLCCDVGNCYYKQLKRLEKKYGILRKRFEELVSDLGWHCVQCTKEADNCMLRIENEKLKKTLQELENLSLKTYDVADFQMYFDKLRGKNDD